MNEVERVYQELSSLRVLIYSVESASDIVAFDTLASKSLLLAAASYFEKSFCERIVNIARTNQTPHIFCEFTEKQALARKYHTLFEWKTKNINKFLALFGEPVRSFVEQKIKDSSQDENMKIFIEMNYERNELVHSNYAAYNLENTLVEIWTNFQKASEFQELLFGFLDEACQNIKCS